ncbi:MAG: hypothetical protein IJ589_11720 [Lachnospiraceae bacterium]|nr:hypothetical protein [Lachnospiraceae bacterium]
MGKFGKFIVKSSLLALAGVAAYKVLSEYNKKPDLQTDDEDDDEFESFEDDLEEEAAPEKKVSEVLNEEIESAQNRAQDTVQKVADGAKVVFKDARETFINAKQKWDTTETGEKVNGKVEEFAGIAKEMTEKVTGKVEEFFNDEDNSDK